MNTMEQESYKDDVDPTIDDVENVDENEVAGVFSDRISRSNKRARTSVLVVAIAVMILAIVGIAYGKSKKLASAPVATLSGDATQSGGNIIEFTIANLNTNKDKCTHVESANRLECVPNHDESANKFRIQLRPDWSPIGVERFEDLTRAEFWNDVRIFRIVPGFISQFGISSNPSTQKEWSEEIQDDPVMGSNVRGTVTFATAGKNTRTTQIFINTGDNQFLDNQGFSPIGEVLDGGEGFGGMEVVDEFYAGYGEKPDQELIRSQGIDYLENTYPLLSFIVSAEFIG